MGNNYDKLYIIIILGMIGAFVYWFQTQKEKKIYCSRCKNKLKQKQTEQIKKSKKVRFQEEQEIITDNYSSLDSAENQDDISIDM